MADRETRSEITGRIRAALDQVSYHRNRDDGGTGARFGQAAKCQQIADAARAELAAFDAEHPTLKAEIDAEIVANKAQLIKSADNQ